MSRAALFAFAMIHFFRPSTSLPMSSSKTRSASSASSRVTRRSVRVAGLSVVSQSCSAFISPSPLYRAIAGSRPPFPAALCAAACGGAFDDEDLALLGIALRAIGELAGQRESVEGALALDEIACLARRLARAERGQALLDDASGVRRVLLEVLAERVVDR